MSDQETAHTTNDPANCPVSDCDGCQCHMVRGCCWHCERVDWDD